MSIYFERIFSQILEMSIIAGYCVLAVLVLRWLFRKAPKKYTYLLWLVVAFRLVCPLTVDSAFSIFNLNLLPENDSSGKVELELPGIVPDVGGEGNYSPEPAPEVGGATNERPDSTLGVGGNTSVVPEIGGTMIGDFELDSSVNNRPGSTISPLPQLPGQTIETKPQTNLWQEIDWQTVCAWVWVLGMIILSVFMIVSWIRLKLRVRTAVKVRTRVYETDMIDSAFVLGIRKPTIYLPVGLDRQEQAWVLLHETSHIRRKDYLVKIIATVLTIVYWFHPLVWVAWFGMCRDMEMSCDEMALEGADAALRKAYSRTLLMVATQKRINWNAITAFGEVSVKSRIKHVLSFKKPAVWMGAVFAVVLVAVLVVFGTNGQAEGGKASSKDIIVDDSLDESKNTEAETNEQEFFDQEESKEDSIGSFSEIKKNILYNQKTMLEKESLGVERITGNNQYIYVYAMNSQRSSGDGSLMRHYSVIRYNPDGTGAETIYSFDECMDKEELHIGYEYSHKNGEYLMGMTVDEDGNLISILRRMSFGVGEYFLTKWNCHGDMLWERKLDEVNGYTSDVVCSEKNILVEYKNIIYVFDQEGILKQKIDVEGNKQYPSLCIDKNGKPYVKYMRSEIPVDKGMAAIDLETGTIGEEADVFWAAEFFEIGAVQGDISKYGYDFVLCNEYSVVGWNFGDEFYTKIAHFAESGIELKEARQAVAVDNALWLSLGGSMVGRMVEILTEVGEGSLQTPNREGIGEPWIDQAWADFDQKTEVEENLVHDGIFLPWGYTGFLDIHPRTNKNYPLNMDYDGDGLTDRVYQRYCEEEKRHEAYLFFGSGEMLKLDHEVWGFYRVYSVDFDGDGAVEIFYKHHVPGADNDGTTYISFFEKDNGEWVRIEIYNEGKGYSGLLEYTDLYARTTRLDLKLQKIDNTHLKITFENKGISTVLEVSEELIDIYFDEAKNVYQNVVTATSVIVSYDEEQGCDLLLCSGNMGSLWEFIRVEWQISYKDGGFMVESICAKYMREDTMKELVAE